MCFFKSLDLPKPSKGMLLTSGLMVFLICLPLPAAAGLYYLTSGLFNALEQALQNGIRAYRLSSSESFQ